WKEAGSALPIIQLCGVDAVTRRTVAAVGCSELSLRLYALAAEHVPASAAELEAFARLWEREATLSTAALYVEAESLDRNDARAVAQVSWLLETVGGPF